MFDKTTEISILYDLYGSLLTEKQNEVLRMYHEEDFSLAEIADELGISRQGVHDTVKKSEKILAEYEEKLNLMKKMIETDAISKDIGYKIDTIIAAHHKDELLVKDLQNIKKTIIENI